MIFPYVNNEVKEQYEIETIIDNVIDITKDCPVCLVAITNGFDTPCGHTFCAPCLAEALLRNPTCPVCRSDNIHTCIDKNYDCTLCVAGHTPGIVVRNVFVNDNNLRYSRFAYMSFYELKVISFKVISLFIVQLFAAVMCIKGRITLLMFCGVCLITTVINMAIISQCSPTHCTYRFNQLLLLLQR